MRLIDEIYLELPFYGSRRIPDELATRGFRVNRKRCQRLMRTMGIQAVYPKPKALLLLVQFLGSTSLLHSV